MKKLVLVALLALGASGLLAQDGGMTFVFNSAGTSNVCSATTWWSATAPVGTCERCGRTITSATGENFRVVVYGGAGRRYRQAWSGCLECLIVALERDDVARVRS